MEREKVRGVIGDDRVITGSSGVYTSKIILLVELNRSYRRRTGLGKIDSDYCHRI